MTSTKIDPYNPIDNPPVLGARKVWWLIDEKWEHKGWLYPGKDPVESERENLLYTRLLFIGGPSNRHTYNVPNNVNHYFTENRENIRLGMSYDEATSIFTEYTRRTVSCNGSTWDVMVASDLDFDRYIKNLMNNRI